jgi:hypothetical protein
MNDPAATPTAVPDLSALARRPRAFALVALLCASTACGSSGGGTGGAGTGGAGTGGSTGTSSDTTMGTGGSGTGGEGTGGTGGAGPTLTVIDVTQGGCFTLATGTATTDNPCTTGDLYLLTGENVDLDSANQGEPAYCVKPGPATSLAAVSSDYAGCAWEAYVEGINGLADTGYVVRDRTGAHHYRMQIVSNTLPALKFHYAPID